MNVILRPPEDFDPPPTAKQVRRKEMMFRIVDKIPGLIFICFMGWAAYKVFM